MTPFIILLFIFCIGCALLLEGAVALIKGARTFAERKRVAPAVIGIAIVALGTTVPEFVVSLFAAVEGKGDIAIGNLVGSNIANIGLIAGIAGLIAPLTAGSERLGKELPFMLAAPFVLLGLGFDGKMSRFDGVVLISIAILFYSVIIKHVREGRVRQIVETVSRIKRRRRESVPSLLLVIVGVAAVIVGAYLTVESGSALAGLVGIPEVVIGLVLIAVGTSLPELAVAVLAQFKKSGEVSLGNILGSNIVNIFLILGVAVVIAPIPMNPSLVKFDIPIMLVFSLLLFLALLEFRKVRRRDAVVFLILYGAYVGYSFVKSLWMIQ